MSEPVKGVHMFCIKCASGPMIRSEPWCFSSSQANPKAKVADPIPGMIVTVAINKYLQVYHMYRADSEALSTVTPDSDSEVRRLDSVSRDALATLQKEFACEGLKHCADFAHQNKSVHSRRLCRLGSSVHSLQNAHFFTKSMH